MIVYVVHAHTDGRNQHYEVNRGTTIGELIKLFDEFVASEYHIFLRPTVEGGAPIHAPLSQELQPEDMITILPRKIYGD